MCTHQTYSCPKCHDILLQDDRLMFLVKTPQQRWAELSLSTIPSEVFLINTNLEIQSGDVLQFYCFHCKVNLASKHFKNFVEIQFNRENEHYRVLLSPICGEKIAYIVMDEKNIKLRNDFFCTIRKAI